MEQTTTLTIDAQVQTFAELEELELRVAAIESLVAGIKRTCIEGVAGALPQVAANTSELRWHFKQAMAQLLLVQQRIGITARARQPALDPIAGGEPNSGVPGLRGSTDTLGLPDLLNLLSTQRKTGSLTLQTRDATYVLEFLEGAVVHAVTNHRQPEWRLGTILEAQSKLTAAQLEESVEAARRAKELLGDHLIRTERVTESDLRSALEVQVRSLFDSLFAVQDARFSFVDGSISTIGQRVWLNITQLLLDAARRQDESSRGR